MILHDSEFKFSDGGQARKYLVVLNDGAAGVYIIVKTTSKPKHKGFVHGCQLRDRYPNFYLPADSCCLRGQSWIMLDEFFEFSQSDIVAKSFSGRLSHVGPLRAPNFRALLECAASSEDISAFQEGLVRATLASLPMV